MHAGALALVIVDDGRCETFDESCVRGGNKERGEGFAKSDANRLWDESTSLLTVLVRKSSSVVSA